PSTRLEADPPRGGPTLFQSGRVGDELEVRVRRRAAEEHDAVIVEGVDDLGLAVIRAAGQLHPTVLDADAVVDTAETLSQGSLVVPQDAVEAVRRGPGAPTCMGEED